MLGCKDRQPAALVHTEFDHAMDRGEGTSAQKPVCRMHGRGGRAWLYGEPTGRLPVPGTTDKGLPAGREESSSSGRKGRAKVHRTGQDWCS